MTAVIATPTQVSGKTACCLFNTPQCGKYCRVCKTTAPSDDTALTEVAERASDDNRGSRRSRVFILRDFILETYGLEYLKEGTILDVAGGKGDLSWLLANADGLDSIVVDPRITDHTKLVRAAQWLLDNPELAAERESPQSADYEPLAALRLRPPLAPPRHLKVFVDESMVRAIEHGSKGRWESYFNETSAKAEESEGEMGHHQPKRINPCDGDSGRIKPVTAARHAVVTTKLIIGFHPDEATEAAIDLALVLQIPFAVVPCCVFPKSFTSRRLSGQSVSSYPDFIKYLRLKHPKIRVCQLPFQSKHHPTHSGGLAKNTVLFILAKDFI